MIALSVMTVLVAQGDRNSALRRKESGASVLVSDSAAARALLALSQPENGALLMRNYDPIDPNTGNNYLGSDGIPNSGDETALAVDEWTGYDPSNAPCFQQLGWGAPDLPLTGTIGNQETYIIRAYRYDQRNRWGTLLVEGNYKGQRSKVAITFSIEPVAEDFPGVMVIDNTYGASKQVGVLGLRGRDILGHNGNVYYAPYSSAAPAFTGRSAPGDATRPNYLSAIWSSSTQDGAIGDTVSGKLIACKLTPLLPVGTKGKNLGAIKTSLTLTGTGGPIPTFYQVEEIALANKDTLKVDTTNGPVYIEVVFTGSNRNAISLKGQAKILNIRTDGKPPQVGDLRFLSWGDTGVTLYDQTCIQDAFFWFWKDELRLLTSGPGCPSGQNTNFEGVVWMEAILSSKNATVNRDLNYLGQTGQSYDTETTSGATSGIAVPDDVASLTDVLKYVDWPARYKYGAIKNWQRVN
ncbi:MAG: hypothetical protein WCD18_14835 [Thermosynechococcaceae cyanobacterium]